MLPYRHPLVAAKEFETLDYLSGGRAIVGIGAGHVEAEFEVLGVDHARRGKLVEEKLPPLIEALEHEWVERSRRDAASGADAASAGVDRGFEPGGDPSRRDLRRRLAPAGTVERGDGGQAAGAARGARARRPSDDDRRHHPVPLRRHPGWDVGEGVLSGAPGDIAEQILADTAEGVNQLQVRFKSRSCDEICDQMAAFGTEVAPILATI